MASLPFPDRFHLYVNTRRGQGPNGDCWQWTGGTDRKGYGKFWMGGKVWKAHRVAYLIQNGRLDDSLMVLHSCDNPSCCNPSHLNQGTNLDNVRERDDRGRNFNALKTHCQNGHEFTPENTKLQNRTGRRICITCRRSYESSRYLLRKVATP